MFSSWSRFCGQDIIESSMARETSAYGDDAKLSIKMMFSESVKVNKTMSRILRSGIVKVVELHRFRLKLSVGENDRGQNRYGRWRLK